MSSTALDPLCISCGRELEPGLASFGSIRCHDCRSGAPRAERVRASAAVARAGSHRAHRLGLFVFALCDRIGAAVLLLLLSPVVLGVAAAILVESRGPIFYRARRVGRGGREFGMLKFRKMRADASGIALTARDDERFTRLGPRLAKTKLDEIPQLWNVLRGEMSFVGPRPEDPGFIAFAESAYDEILRVKPGITGLSQLAYARESEVLDPADPVAHYRDRVLPQKAALDRLYVRRRSLALNLRILFWTAAVVLLRREVAVHRGSGKMNIRRRPSVSELSVARGVMG